MVFRNDSLRVHQRVNHADSTLRCEVAFITSKRLANSHFGGIYLCSSSRFMRPEAFSDLSSKSDLGAA
jgi:hypothetical protein